MRTALRTASQHRTPARLFCINSLSEARHLSTFYERGMFANATKRKKVRSKRAVTSKCCTKRCGRSCKQCVRADGTPRKGIPSPENQGHFCYVQPRLPRSRDKGCSQIMWLRFERRGSYRCELVRYAQAGCCKKVSLLSPDLTGKKENNKKTNKV